MTKMRERLIELLKSDNCQSPMLCDPNCKYAKLQRCYEARTADYLLENGAIVLPCKMGDTIYEVIGSYYIKSVVCAIHISDGSRNSRNHKSESYIVARNENTNYAKHYNINKIGKTVFLTRKEAEKALKEVQGYDR